MGLTDRSPIGIFGPEKAGYSEAQSPNRAEKEVEGEEEEKEGEERDVEMADMEMPRTVINKISSCPQ